MTNTPSSKLDADFMRTLRFSMEDLEANRQGRMTAAQERILIDRRGDELFQYLIPLGIISIPLCLSCYAVTLPADEVDKGWAWFLFVFFSIVFLLPTSQYMSFERKINSDLKQKKVRAKQGKVIVDTRSGRYGSFIVIKIDDITFTSTREAALRFRHLDHYIIYYTPTSMMILSAEPIEPA